MTASPLRLLLPAAALGALALSACTAGTIVIDELTVARHLGYIAEAWPMCTPVAAGSTSLFDQQVGTRSAGSCGGQVTSTYEHENGDTTYVLTFDGFCSEAADGGTLVLDGGATVFEDGTPSDFGPVIERTTLATNGPVRAEHPTATIGFTATRVEAAFGYPDVTPGEPDENNPDVITAAALELTSDNDPARLDFVRGLTIHRTSTSPQTFPVRDGQWGTDGEGFAVIRTAEDEPLVLDIGSMGFNSGALEMYGSAGVLVVRPDPTRSGLYTFELNGQPYAEDVDCSMLMRPLAQTLLAVLVEAPLF